MFWRSSLIALVVYAGCMHTEGESSLSLNFLSTYADDDTAVFTVDDTAVDDTDSAVDASVGIAVGAALKYARNLNDMQMS